MAKTFKRTSSKAWLKKAAVKPDTRGYNGFGWLHEIDITADRAVGCDAYRMHMDFNPDFSSPAENLTSFRPWERIEHWQWTEPAGRYARVDEIVPSVHDLMFSDYAHVTVNASALIKALKDLKSASEHDKDAVTLYTESKAAVNGVSFNAQAIAGTGELSHVAMPAETMSKGNFAWYGQRSQVIDAVTGMKHKNDQVTLFTDRDGDRLIITPGTFNETRDRDRIALIMATFKR